MNEDAILVRQFGDGPTHQVEVDSADGKKTVVFHCATLQAALALRDALVQHAAELRHAWRNDA